MKQNLATFFASESGATAVEYGVLVSIIGLGLLGSLGQLGVESKRSMDQVAATIARGQAKLVNAINLVNMPSFEIGAVPRSMTKLSQIDGWSSAQGFKVWGSGYYGVTASEGDNFLELDIYSGGRIDHIHQTIETQKDQIYSISFDMYQRGNAQDSVEVYWNEARIGRFTARVGSWNTYVIEIVGSGQDRLEFREMANQNNGKGILLDNIKVELKAEQQLREAATALTRSSRG